MKRKISILLLCCFLISLCSGCQDEEATGDYVIYYLNREMTKVVAQKYEMQGVTQEEQIDEVIEQLQTQPDSSDLRYALPADVEMKGYSVSGYQLTLDFSESYTKMKASEEVLVRAAIAKSLLGIPGISYVLFTVQSVPLTDALGNVVGSMDMDSFVENPGKQINSSIQTSLTLYFVNEKGDGLVKETREVHHSSNISLEKLVMEQLIEGPKTSKGQSVVPSSTKVITSSVVDGVCYINLDGGFKNQDYGVDEKLVLYAIVNSLSELNEVDKVQISINGDTTGKFLYVYDLATLYERDLSYMESVGEEESQGEIESPYEEGE